MSTYSRRRGLKRKKLETEPSATAPPSPNHHHSRLLAGYLAAEFLTNSTLLGQNWDPEAAPPTLLRGAESVAANRKCYEEVTFLLKSEETQLAGVFNPSQLVRWLQM